MILTTADVSMTDAFSDDGGASGGSKAVGRKNEAGFAGTALFGSAFRAFRGHPLRDSVFYRKKVAAFEAAALPRLRGRTPCHFIEKAVSILDFRTVSARRRFAGWTWSDRFGPRFFYPDRFAALDAVRPGNADTKHSTGPDPTRKSKNYPKLIRKINK